MKKQFILGISVILFSLLIGTVYGAGNNKSPREYFIKKKESMKNRIDVNPFLNSTEESLVKVTMLCTVKVSYSTGYKNPNKKKFKENKEYDVYPKVAEYWSKRHLARIHSDLV